MQILQRQFEGHQMRVIERDGQLWFVLADVCAALDISNPRNVAARLDEDEKGVRLMDTPGGQQDMTVINESGLYAVLLRSDKPQAKPFRKWVTNDVLPSLRRTGTYTVPGVRIPDAQPLISARGVAAALGIDAKHAAIKLNRAGLRPTHHYLEPRCKNPAYLFPLTEVQDRWPEAAFSAFTGDARPGTAPVRQAVTASTSGKIARQHRPRLLPTDTSTEQLARRLLSLEAQKRAVLKELAALA